MNVPEFKSEKDDFKIFLKRLELFFEVHDIEEKKRNPLLLTAIDSQTYQILRDSCHPSLPKEKTFTELCILLNKHFIAKIAIFRERSKFYRIRQYPNENINNWLARIYKTYCNCEFKGNIDDILRDRFISGLNPSPVLDRLREENETLSLEEAVNIAINKESAMNLNSNNQRTNSKNY